MEINIEDVTGKKRDTKRERQVANQLRSLGEEARYPYILQALQRDVVVGLRLANACLREKKYFEDIFLQGLQTADASEIQFWLKAVVSRLGFRRVVALLLETQKESPRTVEKALYWLPQYLPQNDSEALNHLQELIRLTRVGFPQERAELAVV